MNTQYQFKHIVIQHDLDAYDPDEACSTYMNALGLEGWSIAAVLEGSSFDGFSHTLIMQRPAPIAVEPQGNDDAKLLFAYKKALEAVSRLPFVTEETSWTWSDISKEQTRIARLALEDGVAPEQKQPAPVVESFNDYCVSCKLQTPHHVNNADRDLITCNECSYTHDMIPF